MTGRILPTLARRALVALACAIFSAAVPGAPPDWDRVPLTQRMQAPDLVLTGEFSDADARSTKHVFFDVPAGVVRLGIELEYTGRERGAVIDTGVYDPDGFRGWSGSSKRALILSATDATPAFLPGPIHAGRWVLDLGVPAIRAGERSRYTARVFFWRHGDLPLVSTFSADPLRRGAGWYRGDFHMHDGHSDGFCSSQEGRRVPCPLYKTVEAAAARKLDFIAITDHNTTSHFNDMHELQPFHDDVLLIPGRELTTPLGHANVFGTTEYIDYRLSGPGKRGINDVLHDAAALRGVLAINHPSRITSESCRGCGWTAQGVDYRAVNGIEVANGYDEFAEHPRDEKAGTGLAWWQTLLDQGFRLTAMGGSDTHDVGIGTLGVGVPTTVVFAEELSERAILEGVRAGHVFVDVEGSRDRVLTAEASAGGATADMGDALAAPADSVIRVSAHVKGCRSARLVLLMQGQATPVAAAQVATDDETRSFELRSTGSRLWLRAEVLGAGGAPLLIGNPFYLNYP